MGKASLKPQEHLLHCLESYFMSSFNQNCCNMRRRSSCNHFYRENTLAFYLTKNKYCSSWEVFVDIEIMTFYTASTSCLQNRLLRILKHVLQGKLVMRGEVRRRGTNTGGWGGSWEILLRNILGNTTEKSCGEIVLQMQGRQTRWQGRRESKQIYKIWEFQNNVKGKDHRTITINSVVWNIILDTNYIERGI